MATTILTNPAATVLAVGVVRLDCGARQLDGPLGSVSLRPTAFKVLQALFRKPGSTVSRDALAAALWSGTDEAMWPDSAVSQAVGKARAALAKVGAPSKMLRLMFQQGYRVNGPEMVVLTLTRSEATLVSTLLARHRASEAAQAFR